VSAVSVAGEPGPASLLTAIATDVTMSQKADGGGGELGVVEGIRTSSTVILIKSTQGTFGLL
jgi:hypothetical protein